MSCQGCCDTIRSMYLIMVVILTALVFMMSSSGYSSDSSVNIDWYGHLGGYITGFLLGIMIL